MCVKNTTYNGCHNGIWSPTNFSLSLLVKTHNFTIILINVCEKHYNEVLPSAEQCDVNHLIEKQSSFGIIIPFVVIYLFRKFRNTWII